MEGQLFELITKVLKKQEVLHKLELINHKCTNYKSIHEASTNWSLLSMTFSLKSSSPKSKITKKKNAKITNLSIKLERTSQVV